MMIIVDVTNLLVTVRFLDHNYEEIPSLEKHFEKADVLVENSSILVVEWRHNYSLIKDKLMVLPAALTVVKYI